MNNIIEDGRRCTLCDALEMRKIIRNGRNIKLKSWLPRELADVLLQLSSHNYL